MGKSAEVSGAGGATPELEAVNQNAVAAAALLLRAPAQDHPGDVYEADRPKIGSYEVSSDQPRINILHMTELMLGYQDSATDFFQQTLEGIKGLPPERKPDAVVLSGFLMGDFKYHEKSQRVTLKPGYTSMDRQFGAARQMIEDVQKLGVPVIYNMGDNDHEIAREYTIEVFRKMHKLARSQQGVNWSNIDKMQQHPEWNTHLQFQIQTVFPYCLRAGRRLHSAEEMSQLTGGQIDIEEYFLLFGAHEAAAKGETLPEPHRDWLEKVHAEQNHDMIIADDLNLHSTTAGSEYTDWIRHYFGFSPKPMYQNHLEAPSAAMGQLAARGVATPDMLVVQHNQEAVGVSHGDTWIVSTPGMTRPSNFFERSAAATDVRGDPTRRLVTTRRRIPEPGATMHTRTDDGRHIVTIFSELLQEKKDSGERSTIAMMVDWQTGSPTARPDLQAKFMDMVLTQSLRDGPVHLFFNGDMIQGRNYPDFPNESEAQGLISIEAQEAFVKDLVLRGLSAVVKGDASNLKTVDITIGNHEWNSGTTKWHGYTFSSYLLHIFETQFPGAVVKKAQAVVTPKGDYFRNPTAVQRVGDYGVLVQHMPLERGAKGTPGLPIYQAGQFFAGAGDLMHGIDIAEFGHWHHPQYAMFGNKLAVISGSLAGLSGYEFMRGYRPGVGAVLVHVGGGLPVEVEFISEKALHEHQITRGEFAPATMQKEGYRDDRHFDAVKHGIFVPRAPKSALQKKLLDMMLDASRRTSAITELGL